MKVQFDDYTELRPNQLAIRTLRTNRVNPIAYLT